MHEVYAKIEFKDFRDWNQELSTKQKNDVQKLSMKTTAKISTSLRSEKLSLGLLVPKFQKGSSIIHCLAYKMLVDN